MSSLPRPDALAPTAGSVSPVSSIDGTVALRVSGGKPLRIQAELLAECSSWSAGAPVWHEVLLYRRMSGDYAVGLKTCRSPAGDSDLYHAMIFPELEPALDWLQSYDPSSDLSVELDASDRRISTTDIALRAASLRQRADRVALQYRAMIGELLYRMELGD